MNREIRLPNGLVAIVDDPDYEAVMAAGPWRSLAKAGSRVIYAVADARRPDGRSTPYMHKFLTGWPLTDHRNRNGLDNRRENLRPATPTENNANCAPHRDNASGFKGVTLRRDRPHPWRAVIRIAGRQRHLGFYDDAEAAARAYDEAARELFGQFAWLNFPTEESK